MSQEKEHMESLKKENEYLQKQLENLNQKLKDSEAFKSHFLSNITNEIINPFTSILGISKNISKLDSKNIGQIHSMANLIYNEAFDLDFQLQNIFAAAKIESGEVNLELNSIQPYELIMSMIEDLRFKAENKSQYIELNYKNNLPYNFVTDADKFQIIFKNILLNAIVFGEDKSKISVWLATDEDNLIIKINNKGVLIDHENLQHIFDRFTKLDKTINSINQGHGLGLSVSKAYLDLLEGRIEVESNAENGNSFKVTIPQTQSDANALIRDDDLFVDDSEIF